MVLISGLRAQLTTLLYLQESPHRTALAFAVGAFIAFSPTYGLHTLSVLFCAWAFRLNLVALMAGAFLNNPWTVGPILGATFWTGFILSGFPEPPAANWDDLSLEALYAYALPFAWPFLVGAMVLGLLGAAVGYATAYLLLVRYRMRQVMRVASEQRLPPQEPLR